MQKYKAVLQAVYSPGTTTPSTINDTGRDAPLCVTATFLRNTPSVSAVKLKFNSTSSPAATGFLLHSILVQLHDVTALTITSTSSNIFRARTATSRVCPIGTSPKATVVASNFRYLSVSASPPDISTLCSNAAALASYKACASLRLPPHETDNKHNDAPTSLTATIKLLRFTFINVYQLNSFHPGRKSHRERACYQALL